MIREQAGTHSASNSTAKPTLSRPKSQVLLSGAAALSIRFSSTRALHPSRSDATQPRKSRENRENYLNRKKSALNYWLQWGRITNPIHPT
jgi:hypothetical protein